VNGSKKGGFPVSVESRAKGKKVTVIHNVTGDLTLLLSDLKSAVGSGGVVRDVCIGALNCMQMNRRLAAKVSLKLPPSHLREISRCRANMCHESRLFL
jgi:hypothetical protein